MYKFDIFNHGKIFSPSFSNKCEENIICPHPIYHIDQRSNLKYTGDRLLFELGESCLHTYTDLEIISREQCFVGP